MSWSISFTVPGQAVQFARTGSRGAQRYTPPKQRVHMAAVKMFAATAMGDDSPREGPLKLDLLVEYLIPKSWSAKKRDAAFWKTSAPDSDNLAKLVKDSLNKIVYHNDAQIVWLEVRKVYGDRVQSRITITEL